MIRDAFYLVILIAGWFAVWCATPGHAETVGSVEPTAGGNVWITILFFAFVAALCNYVVVAKSGSTEENGE